jgi:hypothetical protein
VISALAFIVAGIVVLIGPVTHRQRRRLPRNVQEGIWVNRSPEKETAQAA